MWVHSLIAVVIISMLAVSSSADDFSDLLEESSDVPDLTDNTNVPNLNSGMNIFDKVEDYKQEEMTENDYKELNKLFSDWYRDFDKLSEAAGGSLVSLSEPSFNKNLPNTFEAGITTEMYGKDDAKESVPNLNGVNENTDSKATIEFKTLKLIVEEIGKVLRNQTLTVNININNISEKKEAETIKNPFDKDYDQMTFDWLKQFGYAQINNKEPAGARNPLSNDMSSGSQLNSWFNNYYNRPRQNW